MKYYRPNTITDFFELCASLGPGAMTLLAGGTDLMPRYESGKAMPDHLIDLKMLSELNQINISEDEIVIGALTTIQDIQENDLIKSEFTALHTASIDFAGAQIRHRGTIGGNICNASPAGDLLPSLYLFDATLFILGPGSERQLSIQDFILGPGKTALEENEILSSIKLKRTGLHSEFVKVGLRQSMAISVVNVAFLFDSVLEHLKITAGAVAPTIVHLDSFTDAYLKDTSSLSDVLHLIDDDIAPIDDIRATASYRKKVLVNLVRHFITSQKLEHENH